MPRKKKLESYSLNIRDLVHRLGDKDLDWRIYTLDFPKQSMAEKVRFEIYGYLTALGEHSSIEHNLTAQWVKKSFSFKVSKGVDSSKLSIVPRDQAESFDQPLSEQLQTIFPTSTKATPTPPVAPDQTQDLLDEI